MSTTIDWNLLEHIVRYYEANKGEVSKELRAFLDDRVATFYDEQTAKAANERVMPLLRSYLRGTIDGKTDRRNIESILKFLMAMTEKPFASIDFEGDKDVKKFLEQGEGKDRVMEREYDGGWFLKNVDRVVGIIENNISYLESIKSGLDGENLSDVEVMIARYTEMRDRVRALENTCPESQVAVSECLKKIQKAAIDNRETLKIKMFYQDARGTTSANVFKKIGSLLEEAEAILSVAPKGSRVPKSYDQTVLPDEKDKEFLGLINVRTYREQCRALVAGINGDFAAKDKVQEMNAAEVDSLTARISDIENQASTLVAEYTNGLIGENVLRIKLENLDLEKQSLQSELDVKQQAYQVLRQRYSILATTWRASINARFSLVIEDPTESVLMIHFFESIRESLERFKGYINRIDGKDGKNLQMNVMQDFLDDFQKTMANDIQGVIDLRDAVRENETFNVPQVNPLQKPIVETAPKRSLDDLIASVTGKKTAPVTNPTAPITNPTSPLTDPTAPIPNPTTPDPIDPNDGGDEWNFNIHTNTNPNDHN